MTLLAPTFFMEKHAVTAAQLGQFLTLPQAVAFACTFLTASVETLILKAGVPLLTVRRGAELLGSLMHFCFLMAFGRAQTARGAVLAYCGG